MLDIIIIIDYTAHFLQIPGLYCQILQNRSLPSRQIPPVPRFSVLSSSPSSLGFYWWVVPAGLKIVLAPISTEGGPAALAATSQPRPLRGCWGCSWKRSPELMWGWCTMWDGGSDIANEGNQLLQPEPESKGGNDRGPWIYGPDRSPARNQSQLENWAVIITKSRNDRFSHDASGAL